MGEASGNAAGTTALAVGRCRSFLADVFVGAGVDADAARTVAAGLVAAEIEGRASHGFLQAPMCLKRLRAGTLSTSGAIRLVHDGGAVAVYDGCLVLGHAAAGQAMSAAIAKAAAFGISAVAVRSATHFGVAGAVARDAANAGLIGVAMCNTRPMMAAPGGAEAVVGNNPLAIAIPVQDGAPFVFDMAMSAAAMGTIRSAATAGQPIPDGWALDRDGEPTTDAAAALAGLLRPAADAKGFGLALAVDLLCGLLSGGSLGAGVASMYADPAEPADCSWLMVAIDPRRFGADGFETRAKAALDDIRASRRRGGVDRIRVPGDRAAELIAGNGGFITLPDTLLAEMNGWARAFGVSELAPEADAAKA
jgi:LDH2 family malate/lactate/ureidoglycolate dehydrogenase